MLRVCKSRVLSFMALFSVTMKGSVYLFLVEFQVVPQFLEFLSAILASSLENVFSMESMMLLPFVQNSGLGDVDYVGPGLESELGWGYL